MCGGEPSSFYEAWGGGHKEADSDHKYLVVDVVLRHGCVQSSARASLERRGSLGEFKFLSDPAYLGAEVGPLWIIPAG